MLSARPESRSCLELVKYSAAAAGRRAPMAAESELARKLSMSHGTGATVALALFASGGGARMLRMPAAAAEVSRSSTAVAMVAGAYRNGGDWRRACWPGVVQMD